MTGFNAQIGIASFFSVAVKVVACGQQFRQPRSSIATQDIQPQHVLFVGNPFDAHGPGNHGIGPRAGVQDGPGVHVWEASCGPCNPMNVASNRSRGAPIAKLVRNANKTTSTSHLSIGNPLVGQINQSRIVGVRFHESLDAQGPSPT